MRIPVSARAQRSEMLQARLALGSPASCSPSKWLTLSTANACGPGSGKKQQARVSLELSRCQQFFPPFGMLEIKAVFPRFSVVYEIVQVHHHNNTRSKSADSAHSLRCLLDPGMSRELFQYLAAPSSACQGKASP